MLPKPDHPRADSGYYSNQPNPFDITSKMAMRERVKMFEMFMQLAAPTPETSVLDVGVSADQHRPETNFFEKMYPHPARLTATGMEDASFLERERPGVTFVLADGRTLPFPDHSFDLVVSFAVLEHVGSRANQRRFIEELCRVGKRVFVTTPNRWFPVEFHTLSPFLHWLPAPTFRRILRSLGRDFYASEDQLNLLSAHEMRELFPPGFTVKPSHHRLWGWVSNLIYYASRDQR